MGRTITGYIDNSHFFIPLKKDYSGKSCPITFLNRVGRIFSSLSHHLACGSALGGSIQIVIHTTNESSLCEDFF
ncbi:MAG: hypothetical protein PHV03_05555, partial [Desulfitobacteriaceae bacterium]|nr:hypothetical protein [Desulfitobacteriaceae bacterium]MDD4401582.1 hypothetical protein [Desulfitobacteriaceae bacterium]